jgi:signal peptidase II
MNSNWRQFWAVALIPVFLLADQWTKWLVLEESRFNALDCLDRTEPCGQIVLESLPMNLTMLWNRGMSYGLMQSEGIMRWVLSGVMLAIALGFFIWLLRAEGKLLKLALAMVVGGAFGNLIDRVRFGAVVDFIDFSPIFPWVFNIADSCISVGAVLLFVDQFLLSGKKQGKPASDIDS